MQVVIYLVEIEEYGALETHSQLHTKRTLFHYLAPSFAL